MINRRCIYLQYNFLVVTFFLISQVVFAQSGPFFKFPVTEPGIYKITQSHANSLGFGNLDNLSVHGYPGMLPQKLDSADLELQIIPTRRMGESLYFYLEGPHTTKIINGNIHFNQHLYADTLYYLLGENPHSLSIPILDSEIMEEVSTDLYGIHIQKWEESNILSSGRNWYSEPIFQGQSLSFSFNKPEGATSDISLSLKLMGRSLSLNNFEIFANGKSIQSVEIDPIPNTTYGIKGREKTVNVAFSEQEVGKVININLKYETTNFNGAGYLDYAGLVFLFKSSTLPNGIYYNKTVIPSSITASANKIVWKINDFYKVEQLNGRHLLSPDDKVVVFDFASVPSIQQFTPIDLTLRTNPINTPLIILTTAQLISQANRLAAHKNSHGIPTKVVLLKTVFESFGYGTKDLTAIRNFIAYHFHGQKQLKNVLIFGKGTFDYKGKIGGRPNLVPTYSSRNSLNPLTTYSSDDYYGFLEYGQGEWEESASGDEELKLGIGRIPAVNLREATEMVDKIIAYENGTNNTGDWKRKLAFFADDGDNNIHLNDAEIHAEFLEKNHPEFEIQKIYLDRFEQTQGTSGQFSPQAKETLQKTIEDGVVLLNYIGHGNETTLTAEQAFTVSDLYNWPENPLLPLVVTATCEFGRHDSPLIRSGAEEMLFAEKKGAIAMLSTGRPVFSSINFALNKAFIESVFLQSNGEYYDLGSIFRITKNQSLNGVFNRNFSLLGDPSMKLALPELKIKVDEDVLDLELETNTDTLKAMQIVQIKGKVTDPITGAFISGATGSFEIWVYGKPVQVKTLGDESSPVDFVENTGILFKGSGEVKDGMFNSQVFVPGNTDLTSGNGKISVYARLTQGGKEAMGAENIPVGGIADHARTDNKGPLIHLYLGDSAINGNSFDFSKINLLAYFEDESGVDIFSSEHAITISVNDGPPQIISQFYTSLEGDFKKGKLKTILEGLEEGKNHILLVAWDNMGNKSEFSREIFVEGSMRMRIIEHITFPNPAIDKINFRIIHNRPLENVFMNLSIFTVTGNEIYTSQSRFVKADSNLGSVNWNFLYSKTKYPAKGIYIYKLELISEVDGTSDRKSGKIIIQ